MNVHKSSKSRLAKVLALASVSLAVWTTVPVAEAQADILASIARCESHGQQFGSHGRILRNPLNHSVVGIFQINERLHGNAARQLGLNIYSPEGNWAFARHLLRTQGTAPWLASRSCWGGGGYASRSIRHRAVVHYYTPHDNRVSVSYYKPKSDQRPVVHYYTPSNVSYYDPQ